MKEKEEEEEEEENIKEEVYIKNKKMLKIKDFIAISKSIVKIEKNDNKFGTGFFIKFMKISKPFYCLMTNEHIINPSMIKNKETIKISNDNESNKSNELKNFIIILDKNERIIKTFKESMKIDAVIIEILEKDKINKEYFLSPSLSYINTYESFKGKAIQIFQFPKGEDLSFSKGKIIEINLNGKFQFSHSANTDDGSSGSPIFLEQSEEVLGIHKGGNETKQINYGDFIGPINDIINQLKRNGKGIEFYENGEKKYEGNFQDDYYDGDGKFYYENGDFYIGQFKNGKKEGNGIIFDSKNNIKKEGIFQNDKFIGEENSDDQNNSENNDNDDNDDNNNQNNSKENKEDSDNDEKSEEKKEEEEKNEENINNKNDEDNEDINSVQNTHNNNQPLFKLNNNNNNVNNNINNNNNIINDSNNLNNLIDLNVFSRNVKMQIYDKLHPVGNFLGIKCKRCGHFVENHIKLELGEYECSECNINDNICIIK